MLRPCFGREQSDLRRFCGGHEEDLSRQGEQESQENTVHQTGSCASSWRLEMSACPAECWDCHSGGDRETDGGREREKGREGEERNREGGEEG